MQPHRLRPLRHTELETFLAVAIRRSTGGGHPRPAGMTLAMMGARELADALAVAGAVVMVPEGDAEGGQRWLEL